MSTELFQATKLVLELTILHSKTRCELWLKTKINLLTSTEALRLWGPFIETVNITLKCLYVPKMLFNKRICSEIEKFSEFLKQKTKLRNFWS